MLGAYPAGCSPKFVPGFKHGLGQTLKQWSDYAYDPRPPATDDNTLAAHKALVDLLLAEGWEPVVPRGQQWWQQSFRRRVRTEEEGWGIFITVPRWGDRYWLERSEPEGEMGPFMMKGMSEGWIKKDASGHWIKESFFIEGACENGAELVSNILAAPDGSHPVTLRRSTEDPNTAQDRSMGD